MIKPIPKDADGLKVSGLTSGITYVFVKRQSRKHCFVFEEGQLTRIFTSPERETPEGSIIVGRISEIVPSIHCAFVSINKNDKCFIKESDLLPKYNLTRPNGEFKCGDLILVKVIKLPSKGKKATVTSEVSKNEEERDAYIDNARHLTQYSVVKSMLPKYLEGLSSIPENAKIITDDEDIKKEIFGETGLCATVYSDKMVSLSALLGIESKISDAINKKVWLKSGAFLVIEPTEAMTVIDVNSGKNTSKKCDDLYYDINTEAIEMVINQIILRNLSGIIMVDCINMEDASKKKDLIDFAKGYAAQKDPLINIIDITPLGILEITRRKSGNTIYEQFYG